MTQQEPHANDWEVKEVSHSSFPRDAETLYEQYEPLRLKLYDKFKTNFKNEESRNQLMSYIDEQFIILVKEYEIDSPVDFPGYVKRKLSARVSRSFVGKKTRNRKRETTLKEESVIYDLLNKDAAGLDHELLEYEDIFNHIFANRTPTDIEVDILDGWLSYETDNHIIKTLAEEYGVSHTDIEDVMGRLRELVKQRMKTY